MSTTLFACGGTFLTESEPAGTGGSAGASASGGASSGGGSAAGGSPSDGSCSSHSNCLAVVNTADPCFSPSCSAPQAATVLQVANDPCLLLWENRNDPIPEGCAPEEQDISCPAICAQEPECVRARCEDAACSLHIGYEEASCAPSDQCPELAQTLESAVREAQRCSPEVAGDTERQCASGDVQDSCGCPVVVNVTNKETVAAAQEAYDAWNEARCQPDPNCSECPSPSDGVCMPTTGKEGTCVRGLLTAP